MRRRDFIAAFAGAASAWPLAARAQQPALPTIGFLTGASSGNYQPFVTAFKEGLKQTDYVEGRNVASNIVGLRANSIGFPSLLPIWSMTDQR
jgi:putative ABC transport system substrate-binding protein